MFAESFAPIEDVPQFGALIFRLPLAKSVAVREKTLFGARFFFVAAPAAQNGIELVFFDGFQKRHGLNRVARSGRAGFFDGGAAINRVLHIADNQARAVIVRRIRSR